MNKTKEPKNEASIYFTVSQSHVKTKNTKGAGRALIT